ncbi:hypothetical protein PC120_g23192 [Phytophthora cactorum]|nr:hypothetical protein PC120_g23192 [Phytophthora cactorum]
MATINDVWIRSHGSVEILMVVVGVASASITTTQALPLCLLVGWNQGSTFLVTKTVALLQRFPFFLCLTCPALFLIGAIAVTLR